MMAGKGGGGGGGNRSARRKKNPDAELQKMPHSKARQFKPQPRLQHQTRKKLLSFLRYAQLHAL